MIYRTGDSAIRRAATAIALVLAATGLAACGGGGSSSGTVSPPPPPPPATVNISGTVTYDSVPLSNVPMGLNYAATTQKPARGTTVEVVNSSGTVLDSDTADDAGQYQVTVNSNTSVRIRVRAEVKQTTGPSWNVRIVDNTNSNATYVLAGSLASSGTANSTRNLHAPSGWSMAAQSYTNTRAAAPFAILDAMYETVQDFAAVDNAISFPNLQVFWSVQNYPGGPGNDDATGDIGTSLYTRVNGVPTIKVLGLAGNDTDEYDSHVIVHEFGHYFEDQLSRSDSIGGSHTTADILDPRVAFGEGWGNALSAMILDDVIYQDTYGAGQSQSFGVNVENNTGSNRSWYNEGAVQSILYDIYDSANDGADTVSAGLAPLYNTLVDPAYVNTPYFTTIFSFTDRLRQDAAISGASIDALMAGQNIDGTGPLGVGETHGGSLPNPPGGSQPLSLPVYKQATVGGGAVQVCSYDDLGSYNKLGVRQYITFINPSSASRTLTLTKTSGDADRDPDFIVRSGQTVVAAGQAFLPDTETVSVNLSAGEYTVEAYDAENTGDNGTATPPGDACYDFTVQ